VAENKLSSGVQELIDKLHQEGVATGESQAEQIIGNARKESIKILDDARAEADRIIAAVKIECEKFVENGNTALRLASRDVLLRVREACFEEFQNRLKRLVGYTLQDPKFLAELILEVARKTKPEDANKQTRVLLPAGVVTKEAITEEISNVQPGSMAAFLLGLTADVLRDGLTFDVSDDPSPGIRIQIVEDDVQLELTDETLTKLLLQYLAPRYRAILEKVE
jgi:V/A-type H+-transporting ATPase subunit E